MNEIQLRDQIRQLEADRDQLTENQADLLVNLIEAQDTLRMYRVQALKATIKKMERRNRARS